MMNTNNFKNVNQPNNCEIFSSKRSEQEVLVLPPNLLQQLGINLENIENSTECFNIRDLGNDSDKLNGLQDKQKLNSNFEISTNETKKVMALVDTVKSIEKSVLPSPLPWPDNTAQNKKETKNHTSKKLDTIVNVLDGDSNECKVSLLKNNEGIFSCHNKNVNTLVENVDFKSKPTTWSNVEPKGKVNVLSQEFISPEKFNNLALQLAESNNLMMDSLNSISSSCKKDGNEENDNEILDNNNLNGCNSTTICNENEIIISFSENINTNHPSNQENQFSSVLRLSAPENIKAKIDLKKKETVVASEDPGNYREKNNNLDETKETVCYKEKKYESHETIPVTGQDCDCTDIADNRVKEIANYLCQYFLPAKVNNSPKRFETKPKICIQGVEKPGGMIKLDNGSYMKTYQNKIKKIKSGFNNALPNNFIEKVYVENHEINGKVNDLWRNSIVEQLCVCEDFGKLQFYDNKCDYQHIHFWNRNIAQSSSVTLFEIYKSDHIEVPEENDNKTRNNQYVNCDFNQYDSLEEICSTTYLSHDNDNENCVNNLLEEFENNMININNPKSIDFCDYLSTNTDKNATVINSVTTKHSSLVTEGKSTTDNVNKELGGGGIDNETLYGQKRKRSLEETCWEDYYENYTTVSKYKKNKAIVKCALCIEQLSEDGWEEHLSNEHCYISWKEGHNIDLNDERLLSNLKRRLKEVGVLKCTFCGKEKRFMKKFIKHIKICLKTARSAPYLREVQDRETAINEIVKCGICSKEMCTTLWLDHIATEHNYQAWRSTEPPLDLNNQQQIQRHLQIILKQTGELACAKCGLIYKYAKSYMQHLKTCDGNKVDCGLDEDSANDQMNNISDETLNALMYTGVVKCGVCYEKVNGEEWLDHIHKEHNYLARVEGVIPLDINDEEAVRNHLHRIRLITGYLTCTKCGLKRKVIKTFLQHIKICDGTSSSVKNSQINGQAIINNSLDMNDESVCNLNRNVKCGVCGLDVERTKWLDHIHKKHNYLAWIEGRPPIDVCNKEEVWQYLNNLTKEIGGLICVKCGLNRKYVKAYLEHIKSCDDELKHSNESVVANDNVNVDESEFIHTGTVKCGVCTEEVDGEQWIDHIHRKHDYLARIEGKCPLDIDNNDEVQRHLINLKNHVKKLICNKCGEARKFVKSYMRHVNNCEGIKAPENDDENPSDQTKDFHEIDKANNTSLNTTADNSIDMSEFVYTGIVKCGVCQVEVERNDWIKHIQNEHNYLAWIDGEDPLDLENVEQVHAHLYSLSKFSNGLTCKSCGIKRKYVKSFLDHIDSCSNNISASVLDGDNLMECAVCLEKVSQQDWRSHAMNYHYNIAWATGMEPIDLRNQYTVERYLKEYKQVNKILVCKICKTSRASCAGFYAHIITCGKTEQEIDFYKSYCDICNCKYLCIYKNQHIGMHREQELAKERKVKLRAEKVWNDNIQRKSIQSRRKAAQRANTVIENYQTCINKFKHKCSSCGFGTDLEIELEDHECETHSDRISDSDVSIDFDGQSDEESDSDVDSNISTEEAEKCANKKKRNIDFSAKVPRLLFKVNNASHYVFQGAIDFIDMHYTLDVLFPQWMTSKYQELDVKDLPKYLPILDESCKVKIANEGWTTYKRFEAKENKVTSLFAGGSVRCVAWVPVRAESGWEEQGESCGNYLTVATHLGSDSPRLPAAQVLAHRSLIQLWHFADFTRLPKFVLGIAHDYGTVWAMDWCPSGVRDQQRDNENKVSSKARLGLLAVACSNGSAYIFVVPYPNVENVQNAQIIKIKPSAELRLCSGVERNKYQATAICWSQQKGHSVILVGYADGTTAFYNFDCDSPLLKTIEDGVTIIHPFQDERPHNTCISDVGLFPSYGEEGRGWGAWSGASCTGAYAALGAAAPRLHAPLATARATFTPHWPSVIVTADEAIANHTTNELEWHGGGRRLGGQRALATCVRCGQGVAYVPPVLRVTRTHPAFRDQRRDIVGFIHMVPLAKKRSKHVNDDLSMKVEPLIYEDAIKEYGLEFKLKIHMDKGDNNAMFSESKQHFPERFPLADVTSMSFCTSPLNHGKLAVATHSGLIFIVNI